jgi:hypothetical protein
LEVKVSKIELIEKREEDLGSQPEVLEDQSLWGLSQNIFFEIPQTSCWISWNSTFDSHVNY